MGKLVGGDFLLDLSSITFEVGDGVSFINITNEEIIKQLTNLKRFIPNPSMIKPIWVKLYNGDSDKLIVARGTLSVVDTNEFELDVFISGYKLKIHVEFTQMLNEDDDPIDDWYIATNDAKYLFTSNDFATFKVADVKNIDGAILSQLKCGDIVIKADASGEHAYIVTFKSETGICLTYTDAYAIETQSYDKVGDNWVYNSQDLSIINSMEQITDEDGHNRFIEGDIDLVEDTTPFTKEYGKWSLSGTHLLIVLACEISEGALWTAGNQLASLKNVPSWIKDKIVPIVSTRVAVEVTTRYNNSLAENNVQLILTKDSGELKILFNTTLSGISADNYFRVQFDLLIDNE